MKKYMAALAVLLVALSFGGCKKKDNGGVSSPMPSSEISSNTAQTDKTLEKRQRTTKIEKIEPVFEEMRYILEESELPAFDYKNLVYFWEDGKKGVADYEGNIKIEASEDVKFCFMHGFYNSEYQNYNTDFTLSGESEGHGGPTWADYDAEQKAVYYGSEGPAQKASLPDELETLKEMRIIPGKLEVGKYTVPDPQYPVEGFVELNGSFVVLGANGEELTKPDLQGATDFYDGICAVKKNEKWHFIDIDGKSIMAEEYDGAYNFYEDKAVVSRNGKWGCIDKEGKVLLDFSYDGLCTLSNGHGFAEKDGIWTTVSL